MKELADGLQSETSERAQAVSDALAATGRVEESVSQLQGEVRAAITKTDLQVSSEAGERRALVPEGPRAERVVVGDDVVRDHAEGGVEEDPDPLERCEQRAEEGLHEVRYYE